ncbi:hypothetical protein [Streptomyces sp. NPDC058579]|uniref:hypothetical protein n=1 Tax=Streptomyces sp. NPDC058579 TaxID=3346548 RepID=UPI00364F9604
MELSGFEKNDSGDMVLPLSDLAHARQALLTLGAVAARTLGLQLTPSSERYIGDVALDVGEYLPGQWTAEVENYSLRVWQEDLACALWSTGPIAQTLAGHRVRQAAILKRDDGTELAVVKDPRLDVYHIGALRPGHVPGPTNATAPPGVTVPPTASTAAHVIRTGLLPAYTRSVLQAHIADLSDDLTWARETYEAGTIPDPAPADLVDAYVRFAASAPLVIAAIRNLGALTEHEADFLHRVEVIVTAPAAETGPTPVTAHPDPLGWWLVEGGEELVVLSLRTVASVPPPLEQGRRTGSRTLALAPAPALSELTVRRR